MPGQKLAERVNLPGRQGEARCHGVAPTAAQEFPFARCANNSANIHIGDRTRGTATNSAIETRNKRRFAEPILQSAGNDADDTCMPAFVAYEDEGRIRLELRHFDSVIQNCFLNCLAFAVVHVEARRKFSGASWILGGQQIHAKATASNAATGIDPRSECKTQMIGRKWRRNARNFSKRRQAWAIEPCYPRKSSTNKRSIDANQRDHIANSGETDETDMLQKVGRRDFA